MSGFELIAALTSALGWPLAVLVIVVLLRRPITAMLTDRPLRRVKAGPFEAEWDQALAQAETEVQGLPLATGPATADGGTLRDDLESEARTAPAVAVLEAFARVEQELRTIVADLTPQHVSRMSAVALVRLGAQAERITPESVRAVEGISVLRNLSAHGAAREITTEQALEYLDLADAVLFALRSGTRGHGGATRTGKASHGLTS